MDATSFLAQHVPGYADLSPHEREAIAQFTLLWSAMEGRVLKGDANPTSLVGAVHAMAQQGKLTVAAYADSLAYFRGRYFQDGQFTYRFGHLNFRQNDKRLPLVLAVVSGKDNDAEHMVSALLLIVYRLRNNFFHGTKWAYGIKDQQANFEHGAAVLMHVLAAHPAYPDEGP